MRVLTAVAALAAVALKHVAGLADTDTISDADVAQSGYLPNHNMDPAVVDSSQFGQLWKMPFNAKEQFYAKPLVYTPNAGGPQILFLASSQNYIRTLNAKTGALINVRQVHPPFLQAEIGCTDIPNTIGIIGTPVIDPSTDIAYFFSKTYIPNYRTAGQTGVYNGVYYFHGVDINTLEDVDGYPLLMDGAPADNDPRKYFIGGVILQRPSLVQIGNYVYGGFGGHCDLFNYTGLIMGIDIVNKKIASQFAAEAGPLVPQTNQWDQNGGGGQGGIWMSGMALSTDGNRLFWVSGNGQGHENNGVPAAGSSGCRTLGEACASLQIGDGGSLSLADYFQPYDYQNMDGGDQDFGSGGIALLDPAVFKGTGVSKMAVTSGKNGKIYILNANSLGGYKQGPGQTDNVLQTIDTQKAVFGGAGSYPLEGGYIYSTPVGYPTYVYKLGFTAAGVPRFSPAGQSPETSAGRVGVGIPTVTSYKGKEGTAILWMTDPDAGLRAWYAVPGDNGMLKSIKMPQVNGLNKFQRPAFGDTRLYVTDANGVLYCLGSPVNLPLNCTSPVNFGDVALGSKSKQTISCKAIIRVTSVDGASVGDSRFVVDNSTLPKGPLNVGDTFTFPVTWDLTNEVVANNPNASYGNTSPGVKSTALSLLTTNAVAGYSTLFPISLTGNEVSSKAFLAVSPTTLDFGGVVIIDEDDIDTISSTFTVSNKGLEDLVIIGCAYTTDELDDDDVDFTNCTKSDDGTWDLGVGFTSDNIPAAGQAIGPSSSITVDAIFDPINGTGDYSSFLQLWSNGGNTNTILEGSASTAPIANFSISTDEGGWLPDTNIIMDFGDVLAGTEENRMIRICNVGGSVLSISKSKPPNGIFHISDPAELHEEQLIPIGDCAYGTVLMSTNPETYNMVDQDVSNSWTLNTDDLTFGVHVVEIKGKIISHKVGPKNSTNEPVYTYLGCYSDTLNTRLLPQNVYGGNNNSNDNCQELCYAQSYIFAGTQYQTECWCGNKPPVTSQKSDEIYCTFSCSGDADDRCGGDGGHESIFYDSTRYTPGDDGVTGGPYTVNQTGNYFSVGCYSEGTNGRALPDKAPAAPKDGHDIETCRDSCQGYTFFGMEFANECYCANKISNGAVLQASLDPAQNGCSMTCDGNSSEYCGGPNRLNVYQLNGTAPVPTQTAAPGDPDPTPTGGPIVQETAGPYDYLGCYVDNVNGRALDQVQDPIPGNSNSPDACSAACSGYQYFGLEYGAECYCSDIIGNGAYVADGGDNADANGCSMTCAANSSVYCGGPNRLTVYSLNSNGTLPTTTSSNPGSTPTPTPGGPFVQQTAGDYQYYGCYSEGTDGRALAALQNPIAGSTNSPDACAAACSGYKYFGVEYGAECYCDNSFAAGSAPALGGDDPTKNGCSMTCAANSSVYCGGPNRLDVYVNPNATTPTSSLPSGPTPTPGAPITVEDFGDWEYLGCYSEADNMRALSDLGNPIAGKDVTVEACGAACSKYSHFGVEYSGECFCGNKINTGSQLLDGATPGQTGCSMTCSGNATEYCGGPNRLNMYAKNGTATLPTGTSTAEPMSAPTPTSGPTTIQTIGTWSYYGCYTEGTNGRALSDSQNPISGDTVTNEACSAACSGYQYFGTEYGNECYCGYSFGKGSVPASGGDDVSQNGCSMTCAGNSSTYCGGANRLNVYKNSANITTPPIKVEPQTVTTLSGYTYKGCMSEIDGRALDQLQNPVPAANVSVENCAAACSDYTYFGVEYSTECYCSNTVNNGSAVVDGDTPDDTGCNMACKGNATEYCGGPGRLNVYQKAASPKLRIGKGGSLTSASNSSIAASTLFTSGSTGVSTSLASTSSNSMSTTSEEPTTASTMSSTTSSETNTTSSTTASTYTSGASSIIPSTISSSSETSTSAASSSSSSLSTSTSATTFLPTPSQPYPSSPAWHYLGCANLTSPLPLPLASLKASNMTLSLCQHYCSSPKYNYALAGLTSSDTCLCGNALQSYSTTGHSGCNAPCGGNKSEICGGNQVLSVWNLTQGVETTSVKAVGRYVNQGCYGSGNGTVFSGMGYRNETGMTAETCVGYCEEGGFGYAGLTKGEGCQCGEKMPEGVEMVDQKECNFRCSGLRTEFCGGKGAVEVFEVDQGSVDEDGRLKVENESNEVDFQAA